MSAHEPKRHAGDDDDQILHGQKRNEVVEKERQIQQERERDDKQEE